MQLNPFDTLAAEQDNSQQQPRQLIELARQWNKPVRAGLAQLAQTIWPTMHTFGLIPAHSYRLQQRFFPGSCVWWVEHDIPPDDGNWCAAYQVELRLYEAGRPTLNVQSGTRAQSVRPLTKENLTEVLAQTSHDLPLLISRNTGLADWP